MSAGSRPEPAGTVERTLGGVDAERARALTVETPDRVTLAFGRPGGGAGGPDIGSETYEDLDVAAPEMADPAAVEAWLKPVVERAAARLGRPPEALVGGRAAGYAVVADRDVYRWFVWVGGGPKVVSTWVVARNTTHLAMDGSIPDVVRARLFAETVTTRVKRARRLTAERRFDEARAELLMALADRPDLQAAHLAQGELELRAGSPQAAIAALSRAIEVAGGAPAESVDVWAKAYAAAFRRGIARLQGGDARGALVDLDWVLQGNPLHLGALEAGVDAAAAARDAAWPRPRIERARAQAARLAPAVGENVRARLAALASRAGG